MTMALVDRVKNSFGRSRASYDAHALSQARMASHLVARLAALGAPRHFARAFEFGCGSGQLTRALLGGFDISTLYLNDLARDTGPETLPAGAVFIAGDIRTIIWPGHPGFGDPGHADNSGPNEKPDLIASASVIQWLENPAMLLRLALQSLAPGGWLAVSGFGPRQFGELAVLGSRGAAPGLCGSDDLKQAVLACPDVTVDILECGQEIDRIWFDQPRDVLRHLRQTGVNARPGQIWTRGRLDRFCADYIARFAQDGRVPLTYHPVWLVARKQDRV